jgi:hypothetical protein
MTMKNVRLARKPDLAAESVCCSCGMQIFAKTAGLDLKHANFMKILCHIHEVNQA